jgi:hypothetical protein
MNEIDINQTIYQLISTYPKLKDVLYDLGFTDITKPGMLQTVGRIMTIKKGATMKNISLDVIKEKFIQNGFKIKEETHE